MSTASGAGEDIESIERRRRRDALSRAESLADLVAVTGAASEREAYFRAKEEWAEVCDCARSFSDGAIPGRSVVVDGVQFHVHGVTHAGTEPERSFLVERVSELLGDGATVFCEQGIRSMYFEGLEVCEMDDYHWATEQDADLDRRDSGDGPGVPQFSDLGAGIDALRSRVRTRAFDLIESQDCRRCSGFLGAVGNAVSACLRSYEDAATGSDFESFRKSRAAARDPGKLSTLQRHYHRTFLPQPVEREWLRRHAPDMEVVTHARNERMADYAVYHNDGPADVHLVVGAAHQPGILYYLERHRDGQRSTEDFELL